MIPALTELRVRYLHMPATASSRVIQILQSLHDYEALLAKAAHFNFGLICLSLLSDKISYNDGGFVNFRFLFFLSVLLLGIFKFGIIVFSCRILDNDCLVYFS